MYRPSAVSHWDGFLWHQWTSLQGEPLPVDGVTPWKLSSNPANVWNMKFGNGSSLVHDSQNWFEGRKVLNKNGKPSDFMVISMASYGSLNWNPLMSLGCEVVPRPEKMMWLNYAARREAKGLSRGGTGWVHCWRQWGSGCPSGIKLCQLSYVVYVHKNEDSHIVYPPLSTKILMVIHGLYMVYTVLLVDEVSVLVDSANLSNHSFWGWSLQKPSWPMGILETRASTAFVFGVCSGPCETVMV